MKKFTGIHASLHVLMLMLACSLTSHAQRIGVGGGIPAKPAVENQAPALDYADPKEYEIMDVTVSGTQFLDPNSMVSISGLQKGDKVRVPGPAISSSIKRMMDFGTLDDVEILYTKIEEGKIWLNINIKERPRLYKVTFSGLRKGEKETLNDKVKLIKGRVITPTVIKNTQLLIKKHFMDKGFYNITVKALQIPDTTRGQATLNFTVDKGKKVKIEEIEIIGNEAISDATLKKKLKKTKEKKLWHLFTPSKYIPKLYDEDKEKLIAYYRKNGYRDATIEYDSIQGQGGETINIVMKIDEGPKYYYRNIEFTGNYLRKTDFLKKILGINKGDVYNPEELEKKINGIPGADVSSAYMDDGYLYFRATPVEVSVVGDSIDIEIRISEGKQATINRIILNGNTKTSDRVVLRELFTLPGQKFSKTELINTNRQLAQMGYFDPEKIGINPIPNQADGTVDIEYTVEEKPSDQIELSGGWGGYIGFVGTLGLVFNNFSLRNIPNRSTWRPLPSGDGQKLSVRFQANGRQFQTYSLSFSEPWLGGKKPINFGVALTRTVYRISDVSQLYSRNPVSPGKQTFLGSYYNNGITFSLGRRLKVPDRFLVLTHSLSLQQYRLDSLDFFRIGYSNGKSYNVTFNTTLSRNTLSDNQYPRSGSSLSLAATFTPPYSAFRKSDFSDAQDRFKLVEYHKWMFDASWYATITGKLVVSARAHMGFLGSYGDRVGMSPFGRFIVGGSGLAGQGSFALADQDIIGLRGYGDRKVGPLDQNEQLLGGGGVVYNKFVTEIRYPVSLNPQATIFLLGFAEGGNNWGSYREFNPFDIKRSVGGGARIFMPAFGLLGIDWGYGFDKIQGKSVRSGGQFHFTIGQQIR
ncbi:outer membrane protein assembly factor BamA [Persicitalea jodogahamensis]|uniref:Outer membrane protein assembly factor BamA n=1 Tax=Persicitalea jodogahamensis TaxID=402147 RepID=A0A8J3DCM2_9BACT|nr:outer membrane protein assembly factor BamA [Persicitalea jodogahamensis]GHB84069.1 outer membrane protein assembly factor [Persicitalea jodogahamensis]